MNDGPDVIVIGSGICGGAVARRLSENGISVLLIERGDWVPREPDNWSVSSVFFEKKYTARDCWLDGSGKSFAPNAYYNVGGATKFYGGAMIRFRERDFEVLEHEEGLSPAWPVSYREIEPYYVEAEQMFGVHGDDNGDVTAPWRSSGYPFPALANEPVVERMAHAMRSMECAPSALPLAVDYAPDGACIRCKTCDGFPCKLGAKFDAETSLVSPAVSTGRVRLLTNAFARRLVMSHDGKSVAGVEVECNGQIETLTAKIVVVACGAINSTALLLRSATDQLPEGVANRSGVVGRNYMAHNQTAVMGLSARENRTVFQKTLMMNAFYFSGPGYSYPMGHAQMLGKLQGGMLSANVPFLPKFVGRTMARHSMDWIIFSEDLPDPENRILLKDGQIQFAVRRNNLKPHRRMVDIFARLLKDVGYPIVLTKPLLKHSTSHQCGTVRFGTDPTASALDPFCRSHDHSNLYVVDASFMPSSAAVNPALTIAAQALRAADHMLVRDWGVTPVRSAKAASSVGGHEPTPVRPEI